MRALISLAIVGFTLLVGPARAATSMPANSDDAALMQIQALQDRWQGRQHFLYDEHQPGPDTVGASPFDARDCAQEPVRLKRSDGSTVVKRMKRCD